jgi:hypothetical protein
LHFFPFPFTSVLRPTYPPFSPSSSLLTCTFMLSRCESVNAHPQTEVRYSHTHVRIFIHVYIHIQT